MKWSFQKICTAFKNQCFLPSLLIPPMATRLLFLLSLLGVMCFGSGSISSAQPNLDFDGDWLLNTQETNSGVFVSLADTGTDPNNADTDSDGTPDGIEINVGTDPTDPSDHPQRPNIVFILVDDLGYGDIGAFYDNRPLDAPRFLTPQLDQMAREGMMLTHHYVPAPVCAPSRASLLQGLHQGHANVRDNQFDKALADNHTVATILRSAGYYTAHVGKYGLPGPEAEGYPAHPLKRGFGEFFGYLKHRDGHEHYPRNGSTDKKAFLVDGTERLTTNTDKVYTTDVFTARAKQIITHQTHTDPNRPFFLYLGYDTPHFKLQVPSVAYPEGRGLHGGMQWTGATGNPPFCNTATGTINSYLYPEHRDQVWPDNEKIHATMIRRIGECVGDILQLLRDLGIDDNTLVVFSSDNGPHHEGGQDPRFFSSYAFMDGTKRDLWEAGIRVPTMAWWPEHIQAGSKNSHASGFWDWLATFADLAYVPAPAYTDGVSLVPSLLQSGEQREGTVYIEYQVGSRTKDYSEFEASRRGRPRQQMQALRLGRTMGVRTGIEHPDDDFEIYDVVDDPKQTFNLAPDPNFRAMQQRLKDRVLQVRRPGGGVTRPYDEALVPPVSDSVEPGLQYRYYEALSSWVPDFVSLTPTAEGRCANLDLSLRERDNQFGMLFTGYIQITTDGAYTFSLGADSGAHLRIHDAHVIDDDYGRDGRAVSGMIRLQAGLHPLQVFYRHGTGAHGLQLTYTGPGISSQPVPDSVLFRPSDTVEAQLDLRPNILFIMSDDHCARAMGIYGSRLAPLNPTPNLDALARQGMVFDNVFCTNSICTPSRASILTGQYSHRNGVYDLYDTLPGDKNYLPREMKQAGYTTAVIGKWHLKDSPKYFDYFSVIAGQGRYMNPTMHVSEGGTPRQVRFDSTLVRDIDVKDFQGHSSDVLTDLTVDWLDHKRDKTKPFFLMHHFKAPHDMFVYAERYEDYLKDADIPEPSNLYDQPGPAFGSVATRGQDDSLVGVIGSTISPQRTKRNLTQYYRKQIRTLTGREDLTDRELTHHAYQLYVKEYLRCVKGIDDNLQRIIETLKESDLLDNTIIVYTSDQGMLLGEHDYIDKRWMYEESIRMPLIVHYPPMIAAGSRSQWLINNTDMAPTLLALAGVERPDYMQGHSFANALKGAEEPQDWRTGTYYRYWMHMAHGHNNPGHFGIRTRQHKLIFFYGMDYTDTHNKRLVTKYEGNRFWKNTPAAWEFYDLSKDPHEMHNRYDDPAYQEIIRSLKVELKKLRDEIGDTDQEHPRIQKAIETHWDT